MLYRQKQISIGDPGTEYTKLCGGKQGTWCFAYEFRPLKDFHTRKGWQ